MDIIEKIEIKHFRSFDGGKDQEKLRIEGLSDLNVFSGANDSGKSNVLRALNLFFNNEISPGISFNKNRDFSKIAANRFNEDLEKRKKNQVREIEENKVFEEAFGMQNKTKDLRRSDEVISIKLFFNNKKRQRGLPESFWISRSYSKKNNFEGEYIYQTNLKGNAQVTLFLNSFKYEYVPAIKDRNYFQYLFQKLQVYLFEKEDKKKENKFSVSSKKFNEILTAETAELFRDFQLSSGVDANFHIPSTLVDFFRTLSVMTENDVSLFDRGDGIQARFIPEILNEISRNSRKNIIWGFEEPENSYEAKNIRKIKEDFLLRYSRKKQIFITTHTKEFLSIQKSYSKKEKAILNNKKLSFSKRKEQVRLLSQENKSSNISIYRVWKNSKTNNSSLVTKFDENNNEWEKTCDDLGLIQEARIVETLQKKLNDQSKIIGSSDLSLEKQKKVNTELLSQMKECLDKVESIENKIEEYEKPILVIEDKHDEIYKIAYLKINNIPFTKENIIEVFKDECFFTIRRAESAGSVAGLLGMNNTDGYEDKKIIGLFDFDKEGSEKFYHLTNQNNWDSIILGDKSTGFYKKRNQHYCFYSLLLPIPERLHYLISPIKEGVFSSFVEIENLLPENILVTNNFVDEKTILGSKYQKCKKGVKGKMTDVLIELNPIDFLDFKPLFNKIKEIFSK